MALFTRTEATLAVRVRLLEHQVQVRTQDTGEKGLGRDLGNRTVSQVSAILCPCTSSQLSSGCILMRTKISES